MRFGCNKFIFYLLNESTFHITSIIMLSALAIYTSHRAILRKKKLANMRLTYRVCIWSYTSKLTNKM